MIAYRIKKGRANFRPFECPLPIRNAKGWEVEVEFVPGGWSSPAEWDGDQDRADWQKLKGLTSFLSANNKNTSLSVFRPSVVKDSWEINAYTNWPANRMNFDKDSIILVKDGERVKVRCEFIKGVKDGSGQLGVGEAVYTLTSGSITKTTHHPFNAGSWSRIVGTYPGGANNSPGPYGGVAIKDQSILIDFKVLK